MWRAQVVVWGKLRDALQVGFELPDDAELASDLVGPRYSYSPKQQLELEPKDMMLSRGLASPDQPMPWR